VGTADGRALGLIGTHWSKGWIIENNVISHSICSGIALGKYGDQWDNTSANTALVTTSLLGKAKIPGLPCENADASLLKVGTDYFGKKRNKANPPPGPFGNSGTGPLTLKLR
jgi:hypothetical protein